MLPRVSPLKYYHTTSPLTFFSNYKIFWVRKNFCKMNLGSKEYCIVSSIDEKLFFLLKLFQNFKCRFAHFYGYFLLHSILSTLKFLFPFRIHNFEKLSSIRSAPFRSILKIFPAVLINPPYLSHIM